MLCAAAAALIAYPALAQDVPAPAPSPVPSRTPTITTLPGVIPERYSLPGTPAPTPVPVPPPIASPSPTPTPSAVSSPARMPRAAPHPAETPRATEAPAPGPTPITAPAPAPRAEPTPIVATPAPAAVPTPAGAGSSTPVWLWLAGAAGVLTLLGGAWLLLRRRSEADEEEAYEVPEPMDVAAPAPAPIAPPPPPSVSQPVQRPQSDPFEIRLNPSRIALGEREVVLDFELLVGNLLPERAEGARLSLAMIAANPEQDRILDAFHRGPPGEAGEPFDLAPGAGARIPARLALPRERVHVVQLGGRPMFVAMVLVDLRWRSGLSIRRFGADFMIGAAGQGERIGPIWLDRGPSSAALGATRYMRREMAAA